MVVLRSRSENDSCPWAAPPASRYAVWRIGSQPSASRERVNLARHEPKGSLPAHTTSRGPSARSARTSLPSATWSATAPAPCAPSGVPNGM